ncbi:MAG: hypothetical protein HN530_06300 [Gammaproteobacteria bacterium]|jgi:hypothetical protein|nr:hypothetical protein [Gammaproteobacteria bacterium]
MRATIIKLHLFVAAFFAPILLMVAVSGGLYLIGSKGNTERITLKVPETVVFDDDAVDLEAEVSSLLQQLSQPADFEYLKTSGKTLITRPTSRTGFEISHTDNGLSVVEVRPDWIKTIVELHKGHGPTLFKTFQKVMAVGLLFIVLSGLWLGLTAKGLRKSTLLTSAAGAVIFLLLALS